VQNREQEDERYEKCVEQRVERHRVVKQFPRNKDDFDLLYAEVGRWKKTLGEVKQDVARKFEVEPGWLVLQQDGRILCDSVPLNSTALDEFGIHEFQLQLYKEGTEDLTSKLDLDVYYEWV